jgi:phosphoadenosine phosphosulfate reductase
VLKEQTLFGENDKVKTAIARLRLHEPPEGYYVAFSGGKDSCVVLDLVRKAGVKFDVHYHVTTVDPPELVQFIKKYYPEAWGGRTHPAKTMWELIPLKRMPPTRLSRYCCQYLKEGNGNDRFVVTGIRHQESSKRAKRKITEKCHQHNQKRFIHPIIEWSEDEVWEYIYSNDIPYCKLYDEGFKRLGCIMCPYGGTKHQLVEAERWPKYRALYIKAFENMLKVREEKGLKTDTWTDGESVMRWWLGQDNKLQKDDRQIPLFGVMLSETDV